MKYKDIKMFTQRCEEHPDHQTGMITYGMIEQRLKEEIDELREYIEQRKWVGLTEEEVEAIGKDDKVLLAQFHTSVKAIDEMKDPTAQIMKLVIRQQGFNFAKAIEAKLREKNGC